MKIGILTASTSRRSGGLLSAVSSLARGCEEIGCDVHVFSTADQYSTQDAAYWEGVKLHLHKRHGPAGFGYTSGLAVALDHSDVQLVHSHGLWMFPSAAAWGWSKRWGRPMIASAHGMLDPWAVRHSAWKKRLAAALFENAHLRNSSCLHALCLSEYQSMRSYGLSNPVATIPNGVCLPDPEAVPRQPEWAQLLPDGSRILLFLGRIHPKKGLTNLLHAWAQVRKLGAPTSSPWQLVIAGWDQGGHQAELQQLSQSLGISETVRFVGPQFDGEKVASLTRADAFVLPSFSEGLPMAVLEAWSYSVPVLMTPQCNLPQGFEAEAAIKIAPDAPGIAHGLTQLFDLSERERQAIGQRGRELVEERFTWPTVAAQMCAVYAWLLGQGPQPDCVITD